MAFYLLLNSRSGPVLWHWLCAYALCAIAAFSTFAGVIAWLMLPVVALLVQPRAFLPAVLPKIEHLRRLREERGLGFRIQVDGGITDTTVGGCFAAGADAFVAGAYVFGSSDYATPIAALRSACK